MSITKEQYVTEYLQRIGYTGSTEPCLDTLRALQRHHLFHIPFENLDLLGDDFVATVDRSELFDRLVRRRRGGVCYELNSSFYYLLTALGFSACQVSGRCLPELPLTGHVFTLVHLPEGDYTVDVGYGDDPVPLLKIGSSEVVHDYYADYWLEEEEDGLIAMYLQHPEQAPARQYQFTLVPRTPEDYMDTFRFTAAKGNTFFSERPLCCRFDDKGKTLLRRGILTVEEYGHEVERRELTDEEQNVPAMKKMFDLP